MKLVFDLDTRTHKIVILPIGLQASAWLERNGGVFGYRRYGRSQQWFGKLDRVEDCSVAAKEAGLEIKIKTRLKEHVNTLLTRMKRDRDATIARCERTPESQQWRPFTFQLEDIVKMVSARVILNANPMGSGKTCESLLAAPDGAAILILAPKSMKGSWEKNVRRWRTDLTPVVVKTKADWRLPKPGEVIISGYEIIPTCGMEGAIKIGAPLNQMLRDSKLGPEFTLIADEYHVCRKYKSLKTKRVRTIVDYIVKQGGYAFGLTGSPLMKHPPDLWCLLMNLKLTEDVFGNYENFVTQMGGYYGSRGMMWNGKVDPTVRSRLAGVMVLRDKGEVWAEMPGTMHQLHDVDLSDSSLKKWLKAYEDALGSDVAEWTLTRIKNAQPADAPEYAEIRRMLADAKLPAVVEMVESFEEQEEPVVVASAHRHPVEQLGARPGWACIHGGISEKRRTQIVEDFQAGKLRGVAVVIAAGSVGIDLFRANHMIFIDQDWTEELNKQMRARIHRIGQTKTCYYHHFVVAHPVERRVDQILRSKEALFDSIIERTKEEQAILETRSDRIARLAAGVAKKSAGAAFAVTIQRTRQRVDTLDRKAVPPDVWEVIEEYRTQKIDAHIDGEYYDSSWAVMYVRSRILRMLVEQFDVRALIANKFLTADYIAALTKRLTGA